MAIEFEIKYLRSTDVEVFPSGFRNSEFIKSKLTSEENLTSYVGKLSKHKINHTRVFCDPYDSDKIIIVLGGYVFRVNKSAFNSITDGYKYAFICLRDKASSASTDKLAYGKVLANIGDTYSCLDSQVIPSSESSEESKPYYEFRGLGFANSLPSESQYPGHITIFCDNYISSTSITPYVNSSLGTVLSASEIYNDDGDGSNLRNITEHFTTDSISVGDIGSGPLFYTTPDALIYIGNNEGSSCSMYIENTSIDFDSEPGNYSTININNGRVNIDNVSVSFTSNSNISGDLSIADGVIPMIKSDESGETKKIFDYDAYNKKLVLRFVWQDPRFTRVN